MHWFISNVLLNFFFISFRYIFYILDVILLWLFKPMPMIMISSILPTYRSKCNWLFFLMNLPFSGPFTAIPYPIRPSFHLLPWNDKDEKKSSRIWVQENKITSKKRHMCTNKHTMHISHEQSYIYDTRMHHTAASRVITMRLLVLLMTSKQV